MGQDDDNNDSGRAHVLAVAAALAVLGVSVGVDVQKLMAAEPQQPGLSGQPNVGFESIKGNAPKMRPDSVQNKLDSTQPKLPSVQNKEQAMPGMKPVGPSR